MLNRDWLLDELQNSCHPPVKSGVNSASPVRSKRSQRKGASPTLARRRRGRGHRDMRRR